ncbi:MAG: hypothetical protein FWC16_10655 [Defluviitaleaceae bacterium]|nr:hypothetical protein [Defluviitaleaceae bacterium]MCL2275377.1 hypothetical protein [Defluviitaleaceae bacterium]
MGVKNLRVIYDSDATRLGFDWEENTDHVYIYKNDLPEPYLVTLQEYKRRGGYIVPRETGVATFRVGEGENAEEIACVTGRAKIHARLSKKIFSTIHSVYILTLEADQPVPAHVIQYEKYPALRENAEPVIYSFAEGIGTTPITRHIVTAKQEKITVSVTDESGIYDLKISEGSIWDCLKRKWKR